MVGGVLFIFHKKKKNKPLEANPIIPPLFKKNKTKMESGDLHKLWQTQPRQLHYSNNFSFFFFVDKVRNMGS